MVEAILRSCGGALLLLALVVGSSAAYAHRLDEYLQTTLVEIDPGAIRLKLNLTPGVDVAEEVLGMIDGNGDDTISRQEAAAYAEMLKRDLGVWLDGRGMELSVAEWRIPKPSELRTGWGVIQLEFATVPGELAAGAHKLTFENRHLRRLGVYLFNAARPRGDLVRILRQNRNDDQSQGEIEFAFHPPGAASWRWPFALLAAVAVAMTAALVWRSKDSCY